MLSSVCINLEYNMVIAFSDKNLHQKNPIYISFSGALKSYFPYRDVVAEGGPWTAVLDLRSWLGQVSQAECWPISMAPQRQIQDPRKPWKFIHIGFYTFIWAYLERHAKIRIRYDYILEL